MEDNPQEWPKEIIYKDVPALEYENGTVLNADTKKIMKPANHVLFTADKAIEANITKRELAVQAAMRGIAKGANLDPDDFLGGVETLTEAQARLALDTSAGHASTRAYAEVMKTAGMHDRMQQDGRVRMQDASGNSLDAPSMSAAMQLIDALRNK